MTVDNEGLSYRAAGVDIEAADAFVDRIKQLARATHGDDVVRSSDYAGLVELPGGAGLIAATCDGVGTKLLVAREAGRYRGLGQDLVAMSVNDLLPVGARPLLFLDYLATGRLDPDALAQVVEGVADACRESGCALLGGETAEMPGLYAPGDFDLAGFAVGLTSHDRLPAIESVVPGDAVMALPSSGIHSNGYSLVRKAIFEVGGLALKDTPVELSGTQLGDALLAPTRLYVRPAMRLFDAVRPKALAHITGGGLAGRLEKLAAGRFGLRLSAHTWRRPGVFDLVQRCGSVSEREMANTFNLGLGLVAIVASDDLGQAMSLPDGWLHVGEVFDGAGVEGIVDGR